MHLWCPVLERSKIFEKRKVYAATFDTVAERLYGSNHVAKIHVLFYELLIEESDYLVDTENSCHQYSLNRVTDRVNNLLAKLDKL